MCWIAAGWWSIGNHDALIAHGGLYAQLYRHNLTEPEPV